jgi:eukaryotic-like serine/threonine-protein kinase
MDDPRRQRIEQIFNAAVELPQADREALLERACSGDQDLRRQVESLLSRDDSSETLQEDGVSAAGLEDSPLSDIPTETILTPSTPTPQQIGPYRIIRKIGFGGMGVLYEAIREDQFQKRVALKIVKRGMDTASIVRRFHRERQILAGLNHPNVTALLDGGTTPDGRPYFVMEYVEGKPISEYCDARKLSTRQRLELFRSVCAAVHYAHQNLVVHRDLKPSNILVTREGVPKLLDFGIAKILNLGVTPGTLDLTMASMRVMTPEYASPEQVRGEPITIHTDIYSLGVLLYELLTGHRPYRFKSRTLQDITHAICEQQPEKPSTVITRVEDKVTPVAVSATRDGQPEQLRKRLRGDVDNIVLKALHKEAERRYASVEQFSEDIQRHLTGLPVMARTDTVAYRAGKFLLRHKPGVFAASAVALALIGGMIATAREARIAAVERAKAERRFNDVRQLANSVLFELHDGIESLPGSTAVRELLLKRALEYLDRLAKDAEGDVALARELAAAYERIGHVEGGIGEPNLGRTQAALDSFKKALAMREKLAAMNPANSRDRSALAAAYGAVGQTLQATGDNRGALEYVRKAVAMREALAAANPADLRARIDVAIGHHQLAVVLQSIGDNSEAMESRRRELAIFKDVAKSNPTFEAQRNLALGYKYLGGAQLLTGQLTEALENYQAALAIDQALFTARATAEARIDLSFDLSDIGVIYERRNTPVTALDYYNKALHIREELSQADPKDVRVQRALATTHEHVGQIFIELRRRLDAFEHYQKMLQIREALVRADPANKDDQTALARAYTDFGWALVDLARAVQRDSPGALKDYADALRWFRKAADAGDALGMNHIGEMYHDGLEMPKDYAEAIRWYRKAAAGGSAEAMAHLGFCYRDGEGVAKDYAEAVAWFRKAVDGGTGNEPGMFGVGYMYEQGWGVPKNYKEASQWYRKAAEAGHAPAMNSLGSLYQNGLGVVKDDAEALRWYREAAQAGNEIAMANLASAYEKGRGVASDKNEAISWFRKAAAAGNSKANDDLRRLGVSR